MGHFAQETVVTGVTPLWARPDSRFLTRGAVEEGGAYRGSETALAARSRQTALVRVPDGAQ
ncbi:hypothetical protein [Chromatocurvus halotolerans]|uniref:Uncharacterized protein n=1 Tax=Chromatocurvus halotolerans TaxID=1132028 RepID=A0A4R2KU65_9GAMM|nr:hypothetical protein [Chromatocurvus halotolerans]TCO74666.1 hypothetical protein EV688_11225 [Chromatocurvus halotolerans]